MDKYKVPIQPFLFWWGVVLLAWGVAGWFVPFDKGSPYYTDPASNGFYLGMGFMLVWAGFGWAEGVAHDWSTFVGIVFLLLAAVGFAVAGRPAPNLVVTDLENPVENVLHLVLGLIFLLGGRRVLTLDPFLPPRRYREL